MGLSKITDSIFYIPSTDEPLSADVGIIRTEDSEGTVWIFDVGNGEKIAEEINGISERKNIVLSHFHADHITNLDKIDYEGLYAGNFTCKKLKKGVLVEKDMHFDGIHLFPLPSTHSKGCIGLEYGDYAFLGDGTYAAGIEGKTAYNTGLLQETIKVLKSLKAENFLLSHSRPFVQPKDRVIAKLEVIYSYREKNKPYIFIDEITENS